jgi:threonylcarbamoyladenosine tRNA methylthiotransferase MtaB
MNRHYTAPEYAQIVSKIRTYFPDASITTDIMVGFAGETEEEFRQSLQFAEEIAFAKIHVFPYSRRPGTVADRLPDQLTTAVKEARAHEMLALADRLYQNFLQSQIGAETEVLFETACGNGIYEGFTANYMPVRIHSEQPLTNALCRVRIVSAEPEYCVAEWLPM